MEFVTDLPMCWSGKWEMFSQELRKGSNIRYAFFNVLFWLLRLLFWFWHKSFSSLFNSWSIRALMILPTHRQWKKKKKRVRQQNNHVKVNKINDCVRPLTKWERFYIELDFYWRKENELNGTMESIRSTSRFLHKHSTCSLHKHTYKHTNQYNTIMAYLC